MAVDYPKLSGHLEAIAAAVEGIAMGIAVTRPSGKVDYANAWLSRLLGLSRVGVTGLDLAQFRSRETRRLRMDIRRAVLVGDTWQGEIELATGDGLERPLIESVFPLHDDAGRVAAVIHFFHDISDLRYAGKVARGALRDHVTGLPNRHLLADLIRARIALAERNKSGLAVLCLDIEQLQSVNARLGRDAGDALLREVAHRIERALRRSDSVGRIGGDEFAVLIGDAGGTEASDATAQKVLRACTGWYEDAGDRHPVTFSAGIAAYPRHGNSAEALVQSAERAMHAAKAARREAGAGRQPFTGSRYSILPKAQ